MIRRSSLLWTAAVQLLLAAAAFSGGTELLEAEFARWEPLSGGSMGVAAVHLESGRAAFLNPDDSFPLASTYKVAIAVQLLRRVERGELSLSDRIEFGPGSLSPGSGILSRLLDDPGVSISLHNLLELMLLISDNSATDLCLEAAGGGDAVTRCMRDLGIEGLRVDRSTFELIADYVGLTNLPPRAQLSPEDFSELSSAQTKAQREAAWEIFAADPRDSATPAGMARLLEMIWKDRALNKKHCAMIRDIMTRCETGEARLKGLLPEDTVVAHKTGTIGGTTNDAGVITLPDGAGHVIVVGFVKNSELPVPDRERAIAEVARAAHDFFLFNRE